MANLTGSLGIGLSGLQASQEAMSVIGHNIANVNTPGYSQQSAVLTTSPDQNFGNIMFGTGVTVNSVQSLRDQFLNLQVTQSITSQAGAQTRYQGVDAISSAFQDDGTTGLNTQIANFFNSFQTLAGNSTNTALGQNVVGMANTMISEFQSTYQEVTGQIASSNQQVGTLVPEVNTLTAQIATLNHQISNQVNPADDNDAIDQRQQLTDQLAQLVGIQVSTDSENNYQITLDSGAATLVSGSNSYQMTATPDQNNGDNYAISVVSGNSSTDVTGKISNGQLGGALDLRDNILPGYLGQLNQIAGSLVDQVNNVNINGVDASGNSVKGVPIFTSSGNPPQIDDNPADSNYGQVVGTNASQPASASNPPNYAGLINSLVVNPQVQQDPSLIAKASTSGDNSIANQLAALQTATNTVDSNNDGVGDSGPFSSAVTGLVNSVATQDQSFNTTSTNLQNLTTALQTQKSSVSGVDLDQSAAQLLAYQQAYQAAAQFISTISQLTNQLMSTVGAATTA